MGKKSRQGRKRAPPHKRLADASPEVLRETVLVHLERSREREAVKAAKALCKAAPGPESEELLTRARLARAEALLRSGAAGDARQVLDALTSGRPREEDHILLLRARIEARAGRFDPILADLSTGNGSPELREALLHTLRDNVADPGVVARSTVLPADHPLRREARAADRFFRAAVSGPLAPEAEELAAEVPRRSPFAPFVLAGRAVQAAYRGDGESIDRLARLLPGESAPARLLPVLRAIAGGDRSAADSPPERRLLDAVEHDAAPLRRDLLELGKVLETGRIQALVPISRRVVSGLRQSAPELVPEFLLILACEFPPADLFFERIGAVIAEHAGSVAEELRILALAAERSGAPEEAIRTWDEFIEAHDPPLDSRDTALVRMRQATCAFTLRERRMQARYGRDPWDDDWDDDWDEEWDEEWDDGGGHHCHFCGGEDGPCENETGVRTDPATYLEAAAEAWPSTTTFTALLQEVAGSDRDAEAVAVRWHEADPGALPPLLRLLRAAERRGAVRKALRWLEMAEALEPGHAEVRAARFRLLLAGAAHRIRKKLFRLAREDLADLEKTPRGKDPQFRPLLAALRSYAAEDEPGRAAEMTFLEEELTAEGAAFFLRRVGEALRVKPSVPAVSRGRGQPSPELAARVLAGASRIFAAAGWPLVPEPAWVKALLSGLKRDLEPPASDLEVLCRLAAELEEQEILYLLAGRGLRRPGPGRYRFLLHRARAMQRTYADDRRDRCLRAVLTLARQVGDRETDQAARDEFGLPAGFRDFLRDDGFSAALFRNLADRVAEPLPMSEVTHVLEYEANTPFSGKRARWRRRKNLDYPPSLFDF